MTWDMFCSVVDNYGDIGVTWRLARQLAAEHGVPVRLVGGRPELPSSSIRPEIDPRAGDNQTCRRRRCAAGPRRLPIKPAWRGGHRSPGLQSAGWISSNAWPPDNPKPVWLNLEYLSAEDWVAGVHGLPSPHPRLPLTKFSSCPATPPVPAACRGNAGSAPNAMRFRRMPTGARDSASAGTEHLPKGPTIRRKAPGFSALHSCGVSLFSYENLALPGLLQAWAAGDRPVQVLVPVGKALPTIAAWFGETTWQLPGS
jgi:hypothetical protein